MSDEGTEPPVPVKLPKKYAHVRIAEGEVKALEEILSLADPKTYKPLKNLLSKMQKAFGARQARAEHDTALPINAAVHILGESLGDRLVVPAQAKHAWYAKWGKFIKDLGVTEEMIRRAGATAARVYRGPVQIETVLARVTLLAAQYRGAADKAGGAASERPTRIEEFNPEEHLK